jgi:uncharacterized NAD(P)/FAD-binding protein YdhS
MNKIPVVIVIGGGASGMLVCANLLRNCQLPLKIVVVSSGAAFGAGVAYHTASDSHLLNVVTGKMSAFADDPDHFVRWLIDDHFFSDIEIETLGKTYLPRRIYGEYLRSVWKEAFARKPDAIEVKMVDSRAVEITQTGNGEFIVHLLDGKKINGDHIVLATGNAPPRNPSIPNKTFYQSQRYFNNPWLPSSVDNLDPNLEVFIIGNGLTMVDTVLSLTERKHRGVIHSLSPHGFGILQHRHNGVPYNGLIRELQAANSLHQLVTLFNKHTKKVRRLGLSAEPVIDSLRPRTQSLWLSFSLEEKKKFLSRLRHLWGVARHRLPIQTFDVIQRLKIDGKLKVWAGYVRDITESDNMVQVDFFDRKSKTVKAIQVGRVINCTGPETDLQKMNDPLFKNLIISGLISPDLLSMGLQADHLTLQICNSKGDNVNSFYALGGLLRGVLWESTAMGEIRAQAMNIAEQIIANEKQRR